MKDYYYERLLNIKTIESRGIETDSSKNNPYQPTPYAALEKLLLHYDLTSFDHIVDFGCGKGRFSFFIHHYSRASITGIDISGELIKEANYNRYRYMDQMKKDLLNIQFYQNRAEDHSIEVTANCFYFFNPFSIQVFKEVLSNILESFNKYYRPIDLIIYYSPEAYVNYLDKHTAFEKKEEIVLADEFPHDPYERFLIYRLDNS